jgi:hypothetical protein
MILNSVPISYAIFTFFIKKYCALNVTSFVGIYLLLSTKSHYYFICIE